MKTSSKNQINRILTSSIPWTSKIIVQLHKQFRLPVFLFGLLVVTFFLFSKQENTIDSLKERYNQSLQLIQELKHSTDELTKISRQYIITGDKKYREQYSEILAIREGILPRPVNLDYLSIEYTDSKKASKNNGKPIALSALIIKTNLTKNELQLFNSAKNLSDQISNIEIKSMDLIESKNLSNLSQLKKKAIEDLHSDSFVQLTLNAVKPLKELQKIFDDKFLIEISKAEEILIGLRISLMLINLFFILSLWHIYFKFHSAIGAPLSDVQRYLEQIGNGDFITPIHVPIEMQGTILDQVSKAKTSLAKMDSYRKQVERLEIFRSEIFELLIQQTDLSTILLNIVNGVEKLYPNMICSILRLDAEGTHLGQVIAPSLPDFYNKAIDGLKIGDGVGSCGTAAYLGKRVEVDDIQSHPYWAKFKGLAEEADLGSCWSQPFFDSTGKVLGTFAIYHRNSYQLTDLEITTIDLSSQLVSIAIDHTESQNRLVTVYQRLNNLIEAIPDAIFFKDPESRWLITNDPAKQLFKLHDIPWQDKKEMEIAELHPDFWAAHESCLVDDEVTWKNRDITIFSETVLDENGNKKFFEVRKKPIFDDKGERQGLVIIGRDITERVQSEEKLHLAANVFTHAREGISITDADGTIIDVNDTFTRITGYSREEVIGKNPRILSSGMQSKEFYISLWESLFDKGYWFGEIWNRRKNGEFYAEMLTISAVHDTKGKIQNFVALFSDITSAKEYEKQLEHIAHHDVLTGLPNRVLLSSRLEHVMLQTKKNNQSLAVVYCDLDGFKVINDNYGHDTGDRLLMALASRMKDALNETDTLARIGGDEFVAIISNLPNANACTTILDRLLDAAALPVKIDDIVLHVSASLGVTFYPQNEEVDADGLIRQADQAMYQAKLTGKNRYHFFDTVLDSTVKIHYESLDQIRNALNAKEFLLYFQPKVNMRTGQVIGAEALIRWQHPTKGLLLPRSFLPVIEDHPLAIDLGEWVIDTVLTQMEEWNLRGLKIPVSVNIGARQLQDSNFIERLEKILAQHKRIDPSQLELEILETSALEDLSKSSLVIDSCKKLGVNLALDDFGTGYSSLTYLKHLQVALLKIDQTFVKDMLDDPENLAILDGVIGLAAAFRRKVIAEGVETVQHGSMLLQLGCDLAQGYGVAHPMPAYDFPDWVQNWKSDPSWKDIPIINRADLPLLFSATEHRGWIKALEMYLKGERATSLPIDIHLCRFGIWMETEGGDIYGSYPIYKEIEAIHKMVHFKGEELSELFQANRKEDALNGLPDLYKLREELLLKLSELVTLRNHNYI